MLPNEEFKNTFNSSNIVYYHRKKQQTIVISKLNADIYEMKTQKSVNSYYLIEHVLF